MVDGDRLGPEEIRDLPDRSQVARERALEALSLMRERGVSATAAADQVGIALETLKKYAGQALRKTESGAWKAKPRDRITRFMKFPTPKGLTLLDVHDSRTASEIGRYWEAVRKYLRTGDEKVLWPFEGRTIEVQGEFHDFLTDPFLLKRFARAGEISFPTIYGLT